MDKKKVLQATCSTFFLHQLLPHSFFRPTKDASVVDLFLQELDMGIQVHVLFHFRHCLGDFRQHLPAGAAPPEASVHKGLGLVDGQQLNGQDVFQFLRHFQGF